MNKLKVVTRDQKEKCRTGNVDEIRKALDILISNGIVSLKMTKEDHRYFQGYLQSLEEFRGLITKP